MLTRLTTVAGVIATAALILTGTAPASAESDQDNSPPTLTARIDAAVADGAHGAEQLAAAIGLPASGPESLVVDESGSLAATVVFDSAPTAAQHAAVERLARIDKVHGFTPSIAVTASPDALTDLAAIDGVAQVVPVQKPQNGSTRSGTAAEVGASGGADDSSPAASCRQVPSDSGKPLAADLGHATYQVDGTGVKVGILSDSFDSGHATGSTVAQDIAAGGASRPRQSLRV